MDVEKLSDRLNAPIQGTGADGLKLALALLWERRNECPGALPIIVCHDEIVVECGSFCAADAKAWLERAMIEGRAAVLNGADEVYVPVEVEASGYVLQLGGEICRTRVVAFCGQPHIQLPNLVDEEC
jgi:DNA polymerase I-like protein with 3'-5' exonuclease and polymerase domains